MNYKKLGNTNLDVSTICLGTMTWGEQNSQEEGFEQMDYALEQGVNFWDTAEIYSIPPKAETFGHTEIIIGNWFKKTKKREKVILATKVAGPMRSYVRGGGNQFGICKVATYKTTPGATKWDAGDDCDDVERHHAGNLLHRRAQRQGHSKVSVSAAAADRRILNSNVTSADNPFARF